MRRADKGDLSLVMFVIEFTSISSIPKFGLTCQDRPFGRADVDGIGIPNLEVSRAIEVSKKGKGKEEKKEKKLHEISWTMR